MWYFLFGNTLNDISKIYGYTYDEDGNITTETVTTENGNGTVESSETITYTYDDKEQLISAETSTIKYEYTYDDRGNILTEKEYAVTVDENGEKVYTLIEANTDTYVYDEIWKDKLISYNSQTITYDAVGNPTNYMGNTLTWTMGRQLASFGDISYTYNEDGIRTSKTANNVTTKFYLDGTNIIEQTDGTTTLHFFYDSNGEVVGFKYNGNNYIYVKNSMGDVVGIADGSGNLIASYTYDAWGNVTSVTGPNTAIGELNPFRYRSYYYDSDIQMYYLQSRYYNPEIGRFINSDDVNFIGVTTSEIFYNSFAYCKNNPVNDSDPSGSVPYKVLQGIFGGIMGALTQYLADLINVKFFKGQWSSVVDYLKSVVEGAWDAVTNTGFIKALLISVGKNVVEQIINKITKKSNFSALGVFTTVIDFSIDYVISEVLNIKAPKTIKDIKAKARSLGIKGTKKLTQYLNKQVFKINLANITVSNIKSLIKSVIQTALKSVWGSKAKLIT